MLKSADRNLPPLNILIAMPYWSRQIREVYERIASFTNTSLIVDSGAFTAHVSGQEITLKDHLDFLKTIQDIPHTAIQLDVMFNPEATVKNLYESLDRGFDVAPVFTRGEKSEYLQKLIDESRYVFFGALGGGGVDEYLNRALPMVKGKTKFHLLGHTKPASLKLWKPTSVDASSWSSAFRFGSIQLYSRGKLKTYSRKDFVKKPKKEILGQLFALGFTYEEIKKLSKETAWRCRGEKTKTPDYHFAAFVATCSHIYYGLMSEYKLNTKVYLAVGTDIHLEFIFMCYKFLFQRGMLDKFIIGGNK